MSSFLRELRRRNVFKVGVAYLVAAWLVLQIADLLVPILGLPAWTHGFVFLLLVIGLAPALIFAWAYELTPQGLKREEDVDRSQSIGARTGRKLDFAIIGLLSVALVYFVYESRIKAPLPGLGSPAAQTGPEVVVGGDRVAARSIAVLPFINIGGSTDSDYLADGLAETLLHMLAQIDELQVAARTSAFKFKNTNEDVRIIGKQLGVATVLEGSVQRSGEQIRITAQLINVDNGFHLWSGNYNRKLEDIFAIQDEIAKAVVEALHVALLGRLRNRDDQDAEAYDALLRMRNEALSGIGERQAAAIRNIKAYIDTHPDNADAYATLSEAYILTAYGTVLLPETSVENGIAAAEKAIELDPASLKAHLALSRALVNSERYMQAAPVTAKALELLPGNADLMMDQADILRSQGRYIEALELSERAFKLDPLNDFVRVNLASKNFSTGAKGRAYELLSGALKTEPENPLLLSQLARLRFLAGEYAAAMPIALDLVESDADRLGTRQDIFYMYYDMNDMESAAKHLQQLEAVSRDRGADERALFCNFHQDEPCWRAATARMTANRGQWWFSQLWNSRMLHRDGRTDEAIEVIGPVIEYFEATGDLYGNSATHINLAALYHFANRYDERDALLRKAVEAVNFAIEHGWDTWQPYYYLGMAAAARGNVTDAIRNMQLAFDRGFSSLWWVDQDYAWDPVRETEAFQALIGRVRAKNAAMLAEINANRIRNIL